MSFEAEYVTLRYVSTEMNPMFKGKKVPYEWTNTVQASRVAAMIRYAIENWPWVTVTVEAAEV